MAHEFYKRPTVKPYQTYSMSRSWRDHYKLHENLGHVKLSVQMAMKSWNPDVIRVWIWNGTEWIQWKTIDPKSNYEDIDWSGRDLANGLV